MKKNMGRADRVTRILLAVFLVVLVFADIITGMWANVSLVIAAVFIATSTVGFCPLYKLFNINTCGKKTDRSSGHTV